MHVHEFIPSDRKDYEICKDCGTYHSLALLPPDDIYVNTNYWGDGSGRSTLDQQVSNVTCIDECGISKVDRVLQFVPKRGKNVLEIGCAPGALLEKLLDLNFNVFGIEPDPKNIEFICNQAKGASVICGYFPEVTKESSSDIFDCIIAMDVFEHIEDYDLFIKEVHRLLIKGGKAIIMSPIILNKDGFVRDIDFKADEHAWIFTERYLSQYLKDIFSDVEFSRWIVAHEIIICTK